MANALDTTEFGSVAAEPRPVTTATSVTAGMVLGERYKLVRPLASGGMGAVWEGVHLTLNTPVAVKLINPELAENERARGRFLREARAAAALQSPNVIRVIDFGIEADVPYIAMELLKGESLAARLERVGQLERAATLALMRDVVRAVSEAHEAGLVHRDLKPDNIFLVDGPDGEYAKVLDFGIAKGASGGALDATTQTGSLLGTPLYMSPEQLTRPGDVDARSDLWALGVIVHECLLGCRPFQADSVANLAVALWTTTAPPPPPVGPSPRGSTGGSNKPARVRRTLDSRARARC